MLVLRLYLSVCFITIGAYLFTVGGKLGWDFGPVFFGDITSITWPGQFNLDFLSYLVLTGMWVAWRHAFRVPGLLLAVVVSLGGMLFFAPYLITLSFLTKGDLRRLLVGDR